MSTSENWQAAAIVPVILIIVRWTNPIFSSDYLWVISPFLCIIIVCLFDLIWLKKFPFLDGDVPRSTSNGVYISQLIRFATASSYITDVNIHNEFLTQKLLKQGYLYHKLRKTFSKFYRRYYD